MNIKKLMIAIGIVLGLAGVAAGFIELAIHHPIIDCIIILLAIAVVLVFIVYREL